MHNLSTDEELIIFTIWWLRRDLGHAYFSELKQLTSKTMDTFKLGKVLRRLQDCAYIDSRAEGYTLYETGKEIAWKLVNKARQSGNLPPRLTY